MTTDELLNQLKRIEAKLDNTLSIPTKSHLKTKDACDYLSVCPNTLTKICIEYGIEPRQICGSNYYRVKDLENLFTQDRHI